MTGDFFTLKYSMCYSKCAIRLRTERTGLLHPFWVRNDQRVRYDIGVRNNWEV